MDIPGMAKVKNKLFFAFYLVLVLTVLTAALWRTPITAYNPKNEDERALTALFIDYITARNERDVDRFLSTLHEDCRYMVTKDLIASKENLKNMLPDLWMQNDDGSVAFGKCMAWECWNENNYKTGMLINPKFQITGNQANARFKFHSGLFLDDNFFFLTKEDQRWRIKEFSRPVY
jgi:hypothetical protein